MKTVQTNREDLYINDYVVYKNEIFDVIEIEYNFNRNQFIVTARNIETNKIVGFTSTTFRVLVKS